MKLKQIPKDFIVEELYDLNELKKKEKDEKEIYHYFILTKENYAQLKALEIIARIFNTSRKRVHFAGTKDKVGITKQLISISGVKKENLEKNMIYFNDKFKDLKLEYLGEFPSRLNLGDNLGNKFQITIRDITENEIEKAKNNLEEIKENGVLNFFDDQRFGYANNSHIVGKYILKNDVKSAVIEILTSLPPKPVDNALEFVNQVKNNIDKITNADNNFIEHLIEIAPKYLYGEKDILKHLKKHKNDYPGSFRRLHKKLRTLYICAVQSYIFNETIKQIPKQEMKNILLPLISADTEFENKKVEEITLKILKENNIEKKDFLLTSMPELRPESALRQTLLFPKELQISNIEKDDLNENKYKIIIEFELESGAYATNVVKNLFQN